MTVRNLRVRAFLQIAVLPFLGTTVLGQLQEPATLSGDDLGRNLDNEYYSLRQPNFVPAKQTVESYLADRDRYEWRRAAIAKELFQWSPEANPRLSMMTSRWRFLSETGNSKLIAIEIENALSARPDMKADRAIWENVMFYRAMAQIKDGDPASRKSVEEFLNLFPPASADESAWLLYEYGAHLMEVPSQLEVYRLLVSRYPNAPHARVADWTLQRAAGLGKPFELAFTDYLSREEVTTDQLRGKVVVLDFWATWCGGCILQIPELNALHKKYRDKGVEFIGINLDDLKAPADETKLRDFVARNKIEWPQYCSGTVRNKFTAKWVVGGIPTQFIIDREGKLASVDAGGHLERFILKLLE